MPLNLKGTSYIPDPVTIAGIESKEYTVAEIAKLFEVTTYTVKAWLSSGKLQGRRDSGQGRPWKVSKEDLQIFARKRYFG